MADDSMGLTPFDLQAPARLLHPAYSPMGAEERKVYTIKLGHSSTEGEFVYIKRTGEEDLAYVRVPCEFMAHPGCTYCECGDSHNVYFTDVQLRHLRELLRDSA
jgi:hypothetical protein